MRAREIMTENPEAVTTGERLRRAAEMMRDLDVGIIPVIDDSGTKRIRGVITDRDITMRHVAEGHGDDCTVGDHMTHGATTVGPDDDVESVMQRMQREQIRRIPVVEGEDRLVGIISQADLTVKFGPDKSVEVEETIEKISEPAEPNR